MRDAALRSGRLARIELGDARPIRVRYDCGEEESYSVEDAAELIHVCGDNRR